MRRRAFIPRILFGMAKIDSAHKCHSDFSDNQDGTFPIIWARGDFFTQLRKKMAKKMWFGMCGFSHRIFRVSPNVGIGALQIIVVTDLIIQNGRCEEAKRCLARECPLNKTPESTIKKLIYKKGRRPVEFDLSPFTDQRNCTFFKKGTEGGFVVPD
jgi:hypothetical protein